MIQNAKLDGFKIEKWDEFFDADRTAMTWIWNQLMGETEKGDTLEFVMICRPYERLYAGILRNAENEIKAIIPAMYEHHRNGILDTVDYKGCTEHDEGDVLDYKTKKGCIDICFDDFAHEFLTSEKELALSFA